MGPCFVWYTLLLLQWVPAYVSPSSEEQESTAFKIYIDQYHNIQIYIKAHKAFTYDRKAFM